VAKLKRNETEEKGVLSFSLSGRLFGGSGDPKLVETITEAVSKAEGKVTTVVINLPNLEWISSTGLGRLLSLRSSLAKQGIKARLEKPNAEVLGILQTTRLNMIFEVIE
jgi:anti-anti-sigma factor